MDLQKNLNLNIFCDGGSRGNPGPSASAFVVIDQEGEVIESRGHYLGEATNNVAEYQGVLKAFEWLKENKEKSISFQKINFFLDSLLVASQLSGKYKIKDITLKNIHSAISQYKLSLSETKFTFTYIPRTKNSLADALVNKTLDNFT